MINITTTHAHTFMANGDMPMANMLRTIRASGRYMPRLKCNISVGRLNRRICHSSAQSCDSTVAHAAPIMPRLSTQMNTGASTALSSTVHILAAMA